MRMILVPHVALILLSATLVFVVQPIVGKMLLPVLGGTAVVWNTCLVFFQASLLAGYLYAHVLATRLKLGVQIVLHLVLLGCGLAFLPFTFEAASNSAEIPVTWLLGALAGSIGVPFAVISASAPLFQSWFARTPHPDADDPYHLYVASNIGSIIALLAYPTVVEPYLSLGGQAAAWSIGYGLLIALVVIAGIVTWRATKPEDREPMLQDKAKVNDLEPLELAKWVGLAALPSGLLVAVTAHITTDVAPIPLLWMVPLALYLLSYVMAFSKRQLLPANIWIAIGVPAAAIMTLKIAVTVYESATLGVLMHLFTFFAVATMLHVSLAAMRPPTKHLTTFYLSLSFGGVVGGAFVGLLAPVIFSTKLEYPLMLGASVLVYLGFHERLLADEKAKKTLQAAFVVFGLVTAAWHFLEEGEIVFTMLFVVLGLLLARWASMPKFMLGAFGALIAIAATTASLSLPVLERERSYFAAYRVRVDPESGMTMLDHGQTQHGSQEWDGDEAIIRPNTYFTRATGIGKTFTEIEKREGTKQVAVVGLGIGILAAYASEDVKIDYFEIDRLVYEMATDTRYFRFLDACGEHCNVVIGDARIKLQDAPDGHYDLIVEDAFNSDAVPVHLLTKEAMELYLQKLDDNGIIAFHLSNRYLRLRTVVAGLAEHFGLAVRFHRADAGGWPTDWMILARSEEDLGAIATDESMQKVKPDPDFQLWTDDFSNVLDVYEW